MRPDVLGVIGLGALGGSLAWQAKRAGIPRVLGFSSRPADGVAAVRAGALSEVVSSPAAVIGRADLVVLATSPLATLHALKRFAHCLRDRHAWCTDVVGAKGPVAGVVRDGRLAAQFAGSHPQLEVMGQGFEAARATRFRRAVVYVTAFGGHADAAREVADFWSGVLEAEPVIVEPARHDDVVAWTSHLPRAVSAAFAAAAARNGPRGVTYESDARAAAGSPIERPQMWRELLLLNRGPVLRALERYEDALGDLRRALTEGNAAELDAWLARAARWQRRDAR